MSPHRRIAAFVAAALPVANAICNLQEYSGADAGLLRVNHGQILASHNSYHVATNNVWNYTHPPLKEQLAAGLRGFELDLWYDPDVSQFRVMHAPNADNGTTCATLGDCLTAVNEWRTYHQCHFPLFLQLELLGKVRDADTVGTQTTCTWEMVEPAITCGVQHCLGKTSDELTLCVTTNCLAIVFGLDASCAATLPCLTQKQQAEGADAVLTEELLVEAGRECTKPSGRWVQTDIRAAEAETVLQQLEAVLEQHLPKATQRISPGDVTVTLQDDGAGGRHNVSQWPLMKDSRGKAIVWVTQTSAWSASASAGRKSGVFLDYGGSSVAKKDSIAPADTTATKTMITEQGIFVRTRLDTDDQFTSSDRQRAIRVGANVLSTDFLPDVSVAGDKMPWPSTIDYNRQTFLVAGGDPVGCNTQTTGAASLQCSAEMLEDTSALKQAVTPAPTPAPKTSSSAKGGANSSSTNQSTSSGSDPSASAAASAHRLLIPGAHCVALVWLLATPFAAAL
eukprot:TRINITY_DN37235_c0_g1_i1.p1 TRINITY_DN37235_c0_g1~~TRINITY_DN37235_c0_g1_i1.p1  ORF type:complete len:508 (+),score=89.03 TRINITY_DN37235_c0_g1_i1:79-1602(+)